MEDIKQYLSDLSEKKSELKPVTEIITQNLNNGGIDIAKIDKLINSELNNIEAKHKINV